MVKYDKEKMTSHSKRETLDHPIRKRIAKPKSNHKNSKTILELLNLSKKKEQGELLSEPKIFTKYKYSQIKTLSPYIKKSLERLNYAKLTKIQVKSYLPILKKEDCVLKSETGSGKTLAYFIPILNSLIKEENRIKRTDGIRVLIIVPTHELGIQIHKVIEKVSRCAINIVCGLVIGGNAISPEKTALRKGLNIVIGTPARIVYHLRNTARFSLENLTSLVFEECDRILDMGFKRDIAEILKIIQPRIEQIHKTFVSACLSESVETLLYEISQKQEEKIEHQYKFIGFNENLKIHDSPETLNHYYLIVEERKKVTAFLTFLKLMENEKIIVFVSTADQTNFLERICSLFDKPVFNNYNTEIKRERPDPQVYETFDKRELERLDLKDVENDVDPMVAKRILDEKRLDAEKKYEAAPMPVPIDRNTKFINNQIFKIHGYMTQKDRTNVFHQFYNCEKGVLICTDVGSRGLDFSGTRVIVLFDVSPSYKDYINRVGRTARIGNEGSAISFLYEKESNYAKKLAGNCKAKELDMSNLEEAFRAQERPENQNFGQHLDFQMRQCIETYQLHNLARRAFVSFCRAYSRLKDTECFHLKRMNLGGIAKSYGCKTTQGTEDIEKRDYVDIPDSKQINASEIAFLERKRNATIQGIREIKSRKFEKLEFE